MPSKVPWTRLIRFVASDDKTYYGDIVTEDPIFDVGAAAAKGPASITARVIMGDPLSEDCEVTDRREAVKRLLGPFTRSTMPAIRCIGGNYSEHCLPDPISTEPGTERLTMPFFPNSKRARLQATTLPHHVSQTAQHRRWLR